MDKKEIEEMLDYIDDFMINNLNDKKQFVPNCNLEDIEEKIAKLQYYIGKDSEYSKRFRILGNAFWLSKKGIARTEEEANDAISYYAWVDDAKTIAKAEKIDENYALGSISLANLTGHNLDVKVREVFEKKKIEQKANLPKEPFEKKKTETKSNLPKKVTFFDRIKSMFFRLLPLNRKSKKTKDEENNIQIPKENKVNIEISEEQKQKPSKMFREQNRITVNTGSVEEKIVQNGSEKPKEKTEIIAISDIHGNMEKWNCVRKLLRDKPNVKLIIEGDAMDRGQFGLQILLQIKELCDAGIAEYIPGNHDVFAYNTLATQGSKFEDTDFIIRAKSMWERNGGSSTIKSFENFNNIVNAELQKGTIKKPISKNEMISWLGNCPVQKIVNENGIRYALGHAVFDNELYKFDPKFNMNKALIMELKDSNLDKEVLNRFNTCMWYRESDPHTHFCDVSFPKGSVVVAGHTRQTKANIQNLEGDANKPIVYIDCGKGKLQGFNLTKSRHEDLEEQQTR